MKDYQPKKTKYILPQAIYLSTLWTIRDYFRMQEEVKEIAVAVPLQDGMPKSDNISDPTFAKAAKISNTMKRIRAIENAKMEIPEEYLKGIWDNIQYRSPYPMDAGRGTYSRYKSKFIYHVAKNLGLI